jgi:2-polyprenyl-6-methoxyphenol hydroxylase-like FAD-dependent oxidoreductase
VNNDMELPFVQLADGTLITADLGVVAEGLPSRHHTSEPSVRMMKWPLLSGVPLHTWISPSSNILILGDAAYAMLPYTSQSVAIVVEDGAALTVSLYAIDNLSCLPLTLGAFEAEILERTSQMQEVSRLYFSCFAFLWRAE